MKETLLMYHNPNCSTCRNTLDLLKEQGHEVETYEYLKTPPSYEMLKEIIHKLGIKPEDLIRKKESIYKEQYAGKNFSEDEWIHILAENPKLIERPIVINKSKAVVARPIEQALTIL